ncbi:hypothetical protein ACFL46_01035 [Candidatus Neomarinimicrobiota bacterium]
MHNKGITVALMVIFICFSFATAQNNPFAKGSLGVWEEFYFQSSGGDAWENNDGDRETEMQNNTTVGYFIMPGVAVGGQFMLDRTSQGDYKDTMWGFGPSATYFLGGGDVNGSVKGSVFPFATVGFVYLKGNTEYSSGADFEFTATIFGGDVGAMYMLNSFVGFSGSIGYQLWSFNSDDIPNDREDGNKFNLNAGFTIFIP